ncbi:MAG: hypothetical protein NTX82_01950 [Candidatus Parcubacteria bacterium]|nr:hypothetical protein [Candidatus Parcubacteria bacterium]
MSVLLCVPKFGGCGHFGSGCDWENGDEEGNVILCPICHDDHTAQLTDRNFEEHTQGLSEETKQRARAMLDKENATAHGEYLHFCLREGFISNDRLTPEQQQELSAG